MKGTVYTGFHSIEELLKRKKSEGRLYFSRISGRNSNITDLAKKQGYKVIKVSDSEMLKIVESDDHRGLAF
ncbi:MAG: hypothetical protein J7L71_08540, partial [Spirochaetaceae bacterium]|nr:hypothetical protein [Spirochaetaceae bacterium]